MLIRDPASCLSNQFWGVVTLEMADHVEKVKAYIAKHDLEKELSNAVNEAIKQDAEDPYRVIIEYLKDFALVGASPHPPGSLLSPMSLTLISRRSRPPRVSGGRR